jgi:hypothetical protein
MYAVHIVHIKENDKNMFTENTPTPEQDRGAKIMADPTNPSPNPGGPSPMPGGPNPLPEGLHPASVEDPSPNPGGPDPAPGGPDPVAVEPFPGTNRIAGTDNVGGPSPLPGGPNPLPEAAPIDTRRKTADDPSPNPGGPDPAPGGPNPAA